MLAVRPLAIIFGIAGLVPFIAALLVMLLSESMSLMAAQIFYLYSAGIIAFLSGVYWPVSMQIEARSYPLSPITAMALSQVFFVSAGLGLLLPWNYQAVIFPVLFVLMCATDWIAMNGFWPRWYLTLRLGLTTVVVACQVAAGVWLFMVH
jgi:uncharacterized membrane protein